MKEPITKFDLEAAFKALDEIEVPRVSKIKANRPALTEIFSHKSKFDALMEEYRTLAEEYYDVSNMSDLDGAKEAREAEVAQAKLARIEKIVDLDAESPEDLLPSYVGKFIMQCPQCMTLFYKNPEDIEASEENPDVVNVNEICQHCGNDAGYTLVGKVGEATEEETAEINGEQTIDVTSTEEDELPSVDQAADEDAEAEEFSEEPGDIELDALDLEIEDEPEEKTETEESFSAGNGEQTLVEGLTEEADLDVSAEEFEELINSPEFKRPVSDSAARAMMNELSERYTADDDISELIDDTLSSGRFLSTRWTTNVPSVEKVKQDVYRITHPKGGVSIFVEFDRSNMTGTTISFTINGKSFTTKSIREAQNIIIQELDTVYAKQFDVDINESLVINNETLKYAVINPDGTYAGSPCTSEEEARELANQKDGRIIVELRTLTEGIFDKLKDKLADTIDNTVSKLKSREAKADWLLANIPKDANNLQVDKSGQLAPTKNNQKFRAFTVIGFTNRNKLDKVIEVAPDFDDKNLVVGKNGIQHTKTYLNADRIAKGWSLQPGNGPAFIYLSNGKDDPNALFLCEYFFGKLENDQLDNYLKIVKKQLKGAKLMSKGGFKPDESNTVATETDSQSEQGEQSYNIDDIMAEFGDKTANESLGQIMLNIESLQEAALESHISESLVESYGNVAGFKLTECTYTNDRKLNINGTIYFTSGNKRKTTYVFSEAILNKKGKISLRGLNEKLGIDKQFTLTGYTDSNKAFIAESLKITKK